MVISPTHTLALGKNCFLISLFIVSLFVVAQDWKQLKHSPMDY